MKPRRVRERIAFFATAVFSLLIISVWWGSWSANRVIDNTHVSKDISPASAVVDIIGRAKDSTRELLGGLIGSAEYNASSTDATAQVGSAFEDEKNNDIVYPRELIDDTIRTSEASVSGATSTSVE